MVGRRGAGLRRERQRGPLRGGRKHSLVLLGDQVRSEAFGVVFVGQGPASSIPDAGLYAFNAARLRRRRTWRGDLRADLVRAAMQQPVLPRLPLGLAEGKVFMASSDNSTGRSSVYATGLQR